MTSMKYFPFVLTRTQHHPVNIMISIVNLNCNFSYSGNAVGSDRTSSPSILSKEDNPLTSASGNVVS